MMMTKDRLIDQVYLAVTGGKPTQDSNVQRADIESLADAAIDAAVYNTNREQSILNLRQASITGVLPKTKGRINSTYTITPVKDEPRGLYYIPLPAQPIRPQAGPVAEVSPKTGGTYIYATSQDDAESAMSGLGLSFYWLEDAGGEARLYVKGMGYPICEHIVKVQMPVTEMSGDVELGLGENVTMLAVEILTDFFRKQSMSPQDLKMNQTDDAEEV